MIFTFISIKLDPLGIIYMDGNIDWFHNSNPIPGLFTVNWQWLDVCWIVCNAILDLFLNIFLALAKMYMFIYIHILRYKTTLSWKTPTKQFFDHSSRHYHISNRNKNVILCVKISKIYTGLKKGISFLSMQANI